MLKTKSNGTVFVFAIIFFLALLSCNAPGDVQRAKEEVINIRALVKAKNIERIFNEASTEFRDAAGKADLEKIFEGRYDEIGNPEKFELLQTKFETDVNDGSFLLLLVYETKSPTSSIKLDEFVFIIKDGTPKLFNYRYELRY